MTAKRKGPNAKTPAKPPAEPYEPTLREREANAKAIEVSTAMPKAISRMVDGKAEVDFDHPNLRYAVVLVQDAIGAHDSAVFVGLLSQLGNASQENGKTSTGKLNFMLGVMKDIAPKDAVETMLAAQMAAAHMATMTFACRLSQVETIQQQDSAERAFNKLARTFAMQAEALKRYRTGGQQRVIVEHVTVNEGGQAIVGNVETGGRGASEKLEPTS